MREAIAIASAGGADAVAKAVEAFKGTPELERLIYEASVKSDLAGQMFVRLVELEPQGAQRQLAVDLRPAFLKMPFNEAVAFWRERGGDPAILEEVLRAYRRRAAFATDEQLDVISRRAVEEIQRTLEEGNTLRDFRRAMEEQRITLGIAPADPSYLENVYRTNVATAYGAGRWTQMNDPDVLEARPYRQWLTAQDNRVRAEHAPMNRKVWRADDSSFANISPPGGFQCFPGDTVVQGSFNTGLRTLYDGEVVEVLTEAGRRLTVTPNHPIATVDGFTPAGAIREGDQLLGYEGPVNRDELTSPELSDVHEQNAPATIEQVFGAIMEAGASGSIPLRSDYLHGDAQFCRSDIDIVRSFGDLSDGVQAASSHDSDHLILASTDVPGDVGKGCESHLGTSGEALRDSTGSLPRTPALPLNASAVGLDGRPLHEFRFGPAANLRASRYEDASNYVTRDAGFIRDLLFGSAGQVVADKVVSVRRVPFTGHVYDLQSPLGWIVASGIVTSNCRCVITTLSEEELRDEGLQVITSIPAGFAMTPGFGASSFVR